VALEHFQLNEFAYVLVICDYKVPGLNGMELLRKIKDLNRSVRTILTTAYTIEDHIFHEYKSSKLYVRRLLSQCFYSFASFQGRIYNISLVPHDLMERYFWTQKQDIGPSPRFNHAMTYHSSKEKVLLFGGDSNQISADTWEWDGNEWTQVADTGPSARLGSAMTYDSFRKRSVLFGGNALGVGVVNDTWEWDGNEWTQVADSGPSARRFHSLVYDTKERRVVLFGGDAGTSRLNDTWEWDGNEWTQVADTGPSPRANYTMSYDETSQNVVLFSGFSSPQQVPGDTWVWKDNEWKKVQDIGPGSLFRSSMVYTIHGVILFGGTNPGTNEPNDNTWKWNGKFWTQSQDIGPSPRRDHNMAYDIKRDRVVLFGGFTGTGGTGIPFGDTWELRIE
jgi:hypothetical protein